MSKPICKAEAQWKFWKDENPRDGGKRGFLPWVKKQMRKARRRFLNKKDKYE